MGLILSRPPEGTPSGLQGFKTKHKIELLGVPFTLGVAQGCTVSGRWPERRKSVRVPRIPREEAPWDSWDAHDSWDAMPISARLGVAPEVGIPSLC